MIKPGEYRYTIDLIHTILFSSERVAYIMEECKDIINNKMTAQASDYRYKEMLGGIKLSQKSFWDSANIYSIFNIQLLVDMSQYVKKEYGITLEEFLEEQYLDFDSYIYEKIPEFAKLNPITRFGSRRATWADIDTPINNIYIGKYSSVKMTWDFIGAKNDESKGTAVSFEYVFNGLDADSNAYRDILDGQNSSFSNYTETVQGGSSFK